MALALVAPNFAPETSPAEFAPQRGLPLDPELGELLPSRTLRRGISVGISGQAGKTSLLLKLLAGPMKTGCWSAIIGVPAIGPEAADEYGIALDRLALIPDPGQAWLDVAAALLDAVDLVVLNPPRNCKPTDARRLLARARQRHSVLVLFGGTATNRTWPETPDIVLEATDSQWQGLGNGHGALRTRQITVAASGRRLNGPHRTRQLSAGSTDLRFAG